MKETSQLREILPAPHPGTTDNRCGGNLTTKSHSTTNITQGIYWEKHRRVTASAWERSSKELSERRVLYRGILLGVEFSRVEIYRVRISGISSPELGANRGIGGILNLGNW